MPCPVSTVLLPVERMCHLAWQFMDVAWPNRPPIQTETLTAALEVRESSRRRGP